MLQRRRKNKTNKQTKKSLEVQKAFQEKNFLDLDTPGGTTSKLYLQRMYKIK